MSGGGLVRYDGMSSLELVPQVWDLAQRIARTEFVPKALMGRPEAVMAAMLIGHELGVSPLQSLSKIHIIEGRPSISAELMRAIVLQHGHEIRFEESNTTRCTILGRRRESTHETRVTWTHDDAQKAGLAGKNTWRNYPRAMLIARATGELCRMVFADVLAGMSYTTEELTDGDIVDVEDIRSAAAVPTNGMGPPKRRTARAARAATRPAAAPQAPAPPLPGEDGPEDAELVPDAPTAPYEGPDEHHAAKPLSAAQRIAMRAAELGIAERAAKLELVRRITGRQVASANDLTPGEAATVLATLSGPHYQPDTDLVSPPETGGGPPAPGTAGPPPAAPAPPPARRRRPTPPGPANLPPARPPDQWDTNEWGYWLAAHHIAPLALLAEARRIAPDYDTPAPTGLHDIAGTGLATQLIAWAEQEAANR